ncbi:hypothetical protein ORI20_13920 [Mycobacterium sp. CVI_P3]|uniref:Uncharacterized protein n=1 Tax=Mycobacterium pinniadriaticum TaxID=2994102 RepID=A0ABT3SE57_9MYCO|nr:hypothetical protein [Mycobacterium pinniadriaticum]MCX2931377.1 hypothetical protein [Mycobacterium pinniadriaticum]MCX2937801.1 hypothetical protein [Mycobacterium pinniadriaticum]
MTGPKMCLDPTHINHPVRLVEGEKPTCETCGGERLSFQPDDESDSLDELMDPPVKAKPYTVWLNYHTEGWHPHECDTLAECFDTMRAMAHGGEYRITRDVDVEIREKAAR